MQQHICPESHRAMFLTATWHDDKKNTSTNTNIYVCLRKCFWKVLLDTFWNRVPKGIMRTNMAMFLIHYMFFITLRCLQFLLFFA